MLRWSISSGAPAQRSGGLTPLRSPSLGYCHCASAAADCNHLQQISAECIHRVVFTANTALGDRLAHELSAALRRTLVRTSVRSCQLLHDSQRLTITNQIKLNPAHMHAGCGRLLQHWQPPDVDAKLPQCRFLQQRTTQLGDVHEQDASFATTGCSAIRHAPAWLCMLPSEQAKSCCDDAKEYSFLSTRQANTCHCRRCMQIAPVVPPPAARRRCCWWTCASACHARCSHHRL